MARTPSPTLAAFAPEAPCRCRLPRRSWRRRARLSMRAISDIERGIETRPHAYADATSRRRPGLTSPDRERFSRGCTGDSSTRGCRPPDASRARPGDRPMSSPGMGCGPRSRPPPLLGRAHEVACIEAHLEGTGPPVLLFPGRPGIGATRSAAGGGARVAAEPRASQSAWRIRCSQPGWPGALPILQALEHDLRLQQEAKLPAPAPGYASLVTLLPELAAGPIEPAAGVAAAGLSRSSACCPGGRSGTWGTWPAVSAHFSCSTTCTGLGRTPWTCWCGAAAAGQPRCVCA